MVLFAGLEPNLKEDANSLTCHLSFTISNLPTYPKNMMMPHPSNLLCESQPNKLPVTWLKKTLNINFSGFNGIMECAWKATAYSHLTPPCNTPSKSLHTRMGISCQLPKKTQAALEKIKQNVYAKDPNKSHWGIRDMNKIISESASYKKIV
ncbi:hypothetical protein VP01_11735g1 [Puccinia sorghi]|uniref:Uncharacterized protein n=1 Tax=Puccinia sorghi TaxID=27349 RepID=A0A0L6VR84_9BASI|nr:hypothetical protein VP01_11735g1 [Puccinia sorghi]